MKRGLYLFAFVALALPAGCAHTAAPPACNMTSVPNPARANGEAELVGDLVVTCVYTGPSVSTLVNFTFFLSTPLTSRIMNSVTLETEGLLLIDDPQPGLPNVSNGFPYLGQVLGTPGVLAGSPGSGNVYQGVHGLDNVVTFNGVPYVTGGTRIFRFTNIRADQAIVGVNPTNATLAISGPIAVTLTPSQVVVAFGFDGLKLTSSPLIGAIGLNLRFEELFPSAFKKRIENTGGGPLTARYQAIPGF